MCTLLFNLWEPYHSHMRLIRSQDTQPAASPTWIYDLPFLFLLSNNLSSKERISREEINLSSRWFFLHSSKPRTLNDSRKRTATTPLSEQDAREIRLNCQRRTLRGRRLGVRETQFGFGKREEDRYLNVSGFSLYCAVRHALCNIYFHKIWLYSPIDFNNTLLSHWSGLYIIESFWYWPYKPTIHLYEIVMSFKTYKMIKPKMVTLDSSLKETAGLAT